NADKCVTEDTPKFVIYSTNGKGVDEAVSDPANIVAVVYGTEWVAPDGFSGEVVVTALDRANNESAPSEAVAVK
ncbi:MAG: hypothetical protein K2L93_01710, partial [Muribaculaceae bacterium]|nr:hypothetical protein [Muribaculaceae bacterium]